jgi:glycosyltransferase involved in cell wall biosynthesis
MIIAVNTRFLLADYLEGYGYFIHECFKRITKEHPEHRFIFIFDRPYDQRFIYSDNIIPVVAGPPARHPLLWKWWYDVRVPRILKKYKADVFVSLDGHCSLNTNTPQCLVIHDLAFLHYPLFIKRSHLLYYKRNTPRFIKKAKIIATVSQFSKSDIHKRYGIEKEIAVLLNAAKPVFKPIDEEKKTVIKETFTGGKEFFLYSGSIHPRKNLFNLLKGFSLFKRRLKSNFKLVIAGRLAWKYESFVKDLESYKYRQDVILTGYLPESELAALTGAAYAMVYPSFFEGFGVPVLEALQSGVPVITSAHSAMQEVAGDAALYADATLPDEIGDKMMLLYKDEKLREQLIIKGLQKSQEYSWQKTSTLLWQSICNTKH